MFGSTWFEENLCWILPGTYIAIISSFYFKSYWWNFRQKRTVNEFKKSSRINSAEDLISDDCIETPLLQPNSNGHNDYEENTEVVEPERINEAWIITDVGTMWGTITITWSLVIYHLVKVLIEIFGSPNSKILLKQLMLAVMGILASLCRSADHWMYSPRYVKRPLIAPDLKKRRLWLWLFPYFNLAFITLLTDYIRNVESGYNFMDYVKDDEFWIVIANGLVLLLVLHDTMFGVRVMPLYHPPSVEYTAGLLSWVMFSWFTPVILAGQNKQLDLSELPHQITWDRSQFIWWKFTRTDHTHLGLIRRLFSLARDDIIAQGVWQLLATFAEFISPLAMKKIVDFISDYKGGSVGGTVTFFVVLLFVGPLVQGIADSRNFHIGRRTGCRVRSALVGAIFRKMMRLDTSSPDFSSGELTNLMSVDSNAVLEFARYMHFLWTTILSTLICVGCLFYVLGISALGGLGFVILSIPLCNWSIVNLQVYQKELMKGKDARMRVISEVLQGIRIIKLFAWEKNFLSHIREVRSDEMKSLRGYMIVMCTLIVQWNSITTLVGLCTFLVHTKILHRTLTASEGFTSLALFNLLRFPLLVIPEVFNMYMQAKVSIGRIQLFLGRPEVAGFRDLEGSLEKKHTDRSRFHNIDVPYGIVSVVEASFDWPKPEPKDSDEKKSALLDYEQIDEPNTYTLCDISLEARPGQLLCIYGPTGCGKSSLLLAILGEIKKISGSVETGGSIAYTSQRPWIQNCSMRENILFGHPFDATWYNKVLEVCALKPDLDMLESGDMTEIGEKGLTLSGGQQQRVSLARAVYANADVYLLDDVLSAVDAHVGEYIFKECILGALKQRGKTVIMVTHQVSLTAWYSDTAVLMERNGTIAESGDPKELMKNPESRLFQLMSSIGGSVENMDEEDIDGKDADIVDGEKEKPKQVFGPEDENRALTGEEARHHGAPPLKAYLHYCRACGGLFFFLVPYIFLHVSFNVLQFIQNLVLSQWIDVLERHESTKKENSVMWLYIGISAGVLFAVFCRGLFQSLVSLRASKMLHFEMVNRVVRAPIGWFERTPTGRILNRFSSDIQEIDKDLMDEFGTTLVCFFGVVSIILVTSYTVPWLIFALVPISVLSWMVGRIYSTTSRDLKRLDSVTMSPIYAHFTESVAGVSTIRAFAAQGRFLNESFSRVDRCNLAHYNLWVSNRWFNIRIQVLGALVAVLSGAFVVYWGKDNIPATTAGLALLYALNYTDAVKYLVREHALLEMQMNSLERIIEYMNVPQEAPPQVEGKKVPSNWPHEGAICVTDLTIQYPNSSTPVIEKMSFNVEPRSRIGIVGRTGAGKTSLIAALFRLVEPVSGSIVIDGVDILTIGLDDLRSRLAIVPQDPVLFRGTIRSNLDPFQQFSDDSIWSALQRAHLTKAIDSLDSSVDENGSNFSVGQRQLMCMARALVRRASILIMDEATANVDPETDQLIQKLIRSEFRDCTILCIAHRLHTIIFYDKVMVLEKGKVAEFALPINLLNDSNSLFYALCEKSNALSKLTAIAAQEQNRKLEEEEAQNM